MADRARRRGRVHGEDAPVTTLSRAAERNRARKETTEALAEGIRIMVENMGPRQRRDVSKILAETAGDYEGPASTLLLRLAVFTDPR